MDYKKFIPPARFMINVSALFNPFCYYLYIADKIKIKTEAIMDLDARTKLSAVLSSYPFIKDFLIGINPHFKALDNPVTRNTLGRVATLGQVAMVGGMDPAELITKIAGEIKQKTGEDVRVGGAPEAPGERQETLKGIIRDLHKGVDINVLKKRFLDLVKDVSPSEIAGMEQRLMDEGMPEHEVKKLCSVHVEVFRESLEKKTMPGLPAGHPVHTLMLENRYAEGILHDMELLSDMGQLSGLVERLSQIDRHYLRKENQLFPVLEAKGISGPSKVMWSIHDDIRGKLKETALKAGAKKAGREDVRALADMVNDMIYKEEHILFPMALETLTEDDWTRVKQGEGEIGYAWLESAEEMQPSSAGAMQPIPAERVGSLNLDTGQLTAEQVNLILRHMPVDISFVNENDEVVYYSQTEDRIFPRSPGVIGRRVQNCHPPKSVHMVEKLLDAFKKGERDVAEFWIQMKGRFIHIRYFAVRDGGGKYRGTLEVSQDVTGIRGLEGDKRLLDWD
jgi:DUF438 domain-containing protein